MPRAAGIRVCRGSIVVLLSLVAAWPAWAQEVAGISRGGVTYVALLPIARALGDITQVGQGSLTWRANAGVLTVFAASPDALLQRPGDAVAQEISFAAPVLLEEGQWFVSADALSAVAVQLSGNSVVLPDGRQLSLTLPPSARTGDDGRSEVETLDHGLAALRFFAPAGGVEGSLEEDGASLMLTDLSLLALLVPEQAEAVNAAVEAVGSDKPLLVVVTALQPEDWEAALRFQQGERSIEVRYPYRLKLIGGSAEQVGPDAPVTAVVLLPASMSLYRPVTVTWQGLSAEVTFRR